VAENANSRTHGLDVLQTFERLIRQFCGDLKQRLFVFKSASLPTLRSLTLQFVGTAAVIAVLWIVFGGSVWIVLAFLGFNLLGLGIQALELPTGGRPDQAPVPHLLQSAKRRRRSSSR
jgi:hypothetical protein